MTELSARLRAIATVVALGTLGLVSGCAGDSAASEASADAHLVVVTSTSVYADIASTVGGNLVEASSFVSSPDQDPHSYQASTRDILTISDADVVIENGGGYDDFMDQLLDSASDEPTVINVVDISGHTAPADGELNEHVWYDLPTVQTLATTLAEALAEADPGHAPTFHDNADHFNAELQRLIDREGDLGRAFAGAAVGITEPLPGYMLDALGLDNRTPTAFSEAVEEGEDVSVSVMGETLALYSDHQVAALVYNAQTTGVITELILQAADDAQIPVVPVTETLPAEDTYLTWMSANLDHLQRALSTP